MADALRERTQAFLDGADPDRVERGRERASSCVLHPGGTDAQPSVFTVTLGFAVQFGLGEQGELDGHCSCLLGRTGERCDHQCTLACRVLEELEGSAVTSDAVRRLRDAVEPPSPEELVARLGEAVAPPRLDSRAIAPDFLWILAPGTSRDRVSLAIVAQPILKSGALGKPRPLPSSEWEAQLAVHARPEDAPLLKLLRQASRLGHLNYLGGRGLAKAAEEIDPFDLVETLAGHPHVCWLNQGQQVAVRVTTPRVRVFEEERAYRVEIEHLAAERVEVAVGAAGVVVFDARRQELHAVALEAERRRRLAKLPKVSHVPRALGPMLVERLAAAGEGVAIELPPSLAGREIEGDSRIRVVVEPLPSSAVLMLRVRPFASGPACVPGEGEATIRAIFQGERVVVRRGLLAEASAAKSAAERLGVPDLFLPNGTELEGDALFAALEKLDDPANADLVVEWASDAPRVKVLAQPRVVHRVQVTKAADWFGIGGEVEVDGEAVQVARLLAAQRERRQFVEISKGRYARLSRLLENRFERLAELTYEDHGRVMLSRAAAAFADGLLVSPDLQAPDGWREVAARARDANGVDVSVPAPLTADLRDYQREGYVWMRRLAALGLGGVLADDMGLGKTVQAIAMLVARAEEGPQLVLCPASVEFGWLRELARFAPTLRRVHLREIDRASIADTARKGQVVVASYGLLRAAADALSQVSWATVVVDEAQAVKNAATETAKAVRALPAAWKLALTGTPVENHLGDLHGIFSTIAPGVFGPWDQFSRVWAIPIEKFNDRARARALARLVQPLILRRTKAQVLSELPPRTEVRVDVVLPPDERALYEAARREAMSLLKESGNDETIAGDRRFRVLAALTRLRQFACAPHMVLPSAPRVSEKLRVVLEQLDEVLAEGHSALVFSSFVKQLDLLAEALAARGVKHLMLTGETPTTARGALVDAFQRGEAKVFLVSLKAGGTGLNLTAADTVFILDPWWNPAVEDQAADRAHRLGQTRAVTIVRLVAKDTVEERVLALHERKRALVAGVLGDTDVAGTLDFHALVELLQEGFGAAGDRAEG